VCTDSSSWDAVVKMQLSKQGRAEAADRHCGCVGGWFGRMLYSSVSYHRRRSRRAVIFTQGDMAVLPGSIGWQMFRTLSMFT
jgi:hypothetical protein